LSFFDALFIVKKSSVDAKARGYKEKIEVIREEDEIRSSSKIAG